MFHQSLTLHRMLETLESRRLLSAELVNGQLRVDGTDGDDTITLTRDGNQILVEVSGEDDESFNVGNVESIRIRGLEGNDTIDVGTRIRGATILGGDGDDDISGGANNDRIRGGDGADTLSGAQGDDDARGGDGADAVAGGNGDDTVTGGAENDSLFGGQGDDDLRGNADNDRITGGEGGDTIDGGNDNDRLFARDGNKDTLDGDDGIDFAEIDEGADESEDVEDFIGQTANFNIGLTRIDADDAGNTAEVLSFGGNGTADVDVTRTDEGDFQVTFTGDFASTIDPDAIVAVVTPVSGNGTFVSAHVEVVSADDEEIVLNVYTWDASGPTAADHDFSLALFHDPDATLAS